MKKADWEKKLKELLKDYDKLWYGSPHCIKTFGNFISTLLSQQRQEMAERLKAIFKDWWAGKGKAGNVLIDRKRALEEIDNYLKEKEDQRYRLVLDNRPIMIYNDFGG